MVELLRHPNVVKECLRCPDLWREVVDELLRFKAHFAVVLPRIAQEETKLDGTTIPKGTVVLPSLTGAAHDPAYVERPGELIPGQNAPSSIAFGAGPHFCPGAALTRQWLQVGLATFFERFPNAHLATPFSELEWQEGSLSTPRHIPVRLTAA